MASSPLPAISRLRESMRSMSPIPGRAVSRTQNRPRRSSMWAELKDVSSLDEIAPERIVMYKSVFSALDVDGSKTVDSTEMRDALTILQIDISKASMDRLCGAIDNDFGGEVGLDDFCVLFHNAAYVEQRRQAALQGVERASSARTGQGSGFFGSILAREQEMVKRSGSARDLGNGKVAAAATVGATQLTARAPSVVERCLSSVPTWRRRLWALFDDPDSSRAARAVSAWLMFLILVSSAAFVIETIPPLHRRNADLWLVVEWFCIAFFTLEFVARAVCCPKPREFWSAPMNWVDFLAIVPFYAEVVLAGIASVQGSQVLRTMRLVRVFRVFKVGRHLSWITVFTRTMQRAAAPLGMALFVVYLVVILFSSLLYFVERGEYSEARDAYIRGDGTPSPFSSIPEAGYFVVVTVTTVGLGDTVPITGLGKVLSALCAVVGVLVMAIPIASISTSFLTEFHASTRRKQVQEEQTLKLEQTRQALGATTNTSGFDDPYLRAVLDTFRSKQRRQQALLRSRGRDMRLEIVFRTLMRLDDHNFFDPTQPLASRLGTRLFAQWSKRARGAGGTGPTHPSGAGGERVGAQSEGGNARVAASKQLKLATEGEVTATDGDDAPDDAPDDATHSVSGLTSLEDDVEAAALEGGA